jgi:hypothetical protein
MVSVLVIRPKVRGFKPSRGDRFLRAITIRSIPSFLWEVKPEVPCRKFLRHVKKSCVAWSRCYAGKIQGHFLPSPWVTARCLWCRQRALMDESGVLELRWGRTIRQKMVAVLGTLCSTPPSNSNSNPATSKSSLYYSTNSLNGHFSRVTTDHSVYTQRDVRRRHHDNCKVYNQQSARALIGTSTWWNISAARLSCR